MLVAGALMADYVRIDKYLGPALMKVVEEFPFKYPISVISRLPGAEIIEVPRDEEVQIAKTQGFYMGRTEAELKAMIAAYKKRIRGLKELPYNAIMIAPFGSRKTYGIEEKVRSGVIELLQTGITVVVTYSHRTDLGTIFPSYEVFVMEPFNFEPGENEFVISNTITGIYRRLDETVGRSGIITL